MIIGIDASKAAREQRTGVEHYIYQLILHLQKIDSKNTYLMYTNAPLPKELTSKSNFTEKLTPVKRFWNKIYLPLAVLREKNDVYIQPTDLIPWSAPKKSISIIHDLAYKHFPEAYSAKQRLEQTQGLKNAANRAERIICVSESVKKDLVKYWPKTKDKIKVIPLGFDSKTFHPFEKPRDLLHFGQYILYTGRIETRKNTARLVSAFNIVKEKHKIPHKLVLAGSPGQNYENILKLIKASPFCNDIIMPGYIDHTKLPEIIARADVFVFPSLYEGFGLSLVEAMACGAPILTSSTSCIPEVVGDAALLCNPKDENDIAEKLYKLISDAKLQARLAKSGILRSKMYSWDKTAKMTLELLEEM